jgi:hypothetical protein
MRILKIFGRKSHYTLGWLLENAVTLLLALSICRDYVKTFYVISSHDAAASSFVGKKKTINKCIARYLQPMDPPRRL